MSEKIEIIVVVKDKISGAIKKITKEVSNTGKQSVKAAGGVKRLGRSLTETGKDAKKSQKAIKDTGKSISALGKSFSGMATAVGASIGTVVAAGYTLKKVYDFAVPSYFMNN